MSPYEYTVGAVAELAGVSVRTLHHYDEELNARRLGISLTPEERLAVFGNTRLEDGAERAEQRWGDSELWRQRQRRTARYSAEDWLEIRTEQAGIHQRLLDAMRTGAPPDDPVVMDLAEEHRLHLDQRFHDCDHDTHRGLARLYLAKHRIGRDSDDMAPGLARYIHDAIIANADRAPADPR